MFQYGRSLEGKPTADGYGVLKELKSDRASQIVRHNQICLSWSWLATLHYLNGIWKRLGVEALMLRVFRRNK